MITKFSVLYVGQIELDNVGKDGTPADARRYPNERFAETYFTARDVARTMDELGYYCLWMAEHHFQREGYEVIPNLLLYSTWLATQTRRLKFGCAFNVLPMWHPVRLAEDYAMADILTGGRVIMGVGRGYHTREVESFGAPMRDSKLAGTVKLPRIDDAVKAGGFLAGTPADIIEQLKAVEKRYPGIDRVICATPLGTPLDVQLEDLERLAKEVMPAFGGGKLAAAAE